jgi:hypothetical protein
MDAIRFILLMTGCLAIYFLPTFCGMKKRNAGAIFALNLLLGWTLVGWVVSLVWALTVEAPTHPHPTCGMCGAPLRLTDRFCPSCAVPIAW